MALTGAGRSHQMPRRPSPWGDAASGGFSKNRGVDRLTRSRVGARLGLGVLETGAMRRLLVAQLASTSGDFLVIAALPFAIFSIGGSSAQVGIAFGGGALCEVLVVLFGGVIGDRFQRRAVMVAADALRFSSQAILAVLLILGAADFWQLLVVQTLQGVGAAFFNPAMSGMVPDVVPGRWLHEANAFLTTAFAVGTMVGPALAGLLIVVGGVGWAFALDSATFAVSAALLASIHMSPASSKKETGSMVGSLLKGWREFRRRTWLWVVVAEFALLNALVLGPFQMLGASVAAESLGGPGAWAIILTAAGVGRLGGGLIPLLWHPQRPLFSATLLIISWSLPLALLGVAAPLPVIALAAAIAGATLSVFGALWHTTLQTRVPRDQRSRMSSYDWLGSLALLPLGYLIAGSAQSAIGAQATLIAGACVVLISTAIVVPLPAIRSVRAGELSRPLSLIPAASKQSI
jgi:MFS family permease